MTTAAAPAPRRGRLIAYGAVAGLGALLAVTVAGGAAALAGGFAADPLLRVQSMGWGVLVGLLIGGALLAQALRPDRRVAQLYQLAACLVAVIAATLLAHGGSAAAAAASLHPAALALAGLVVALVAVHPARRLLVRRTGPSAASMTILSIVLFVYGVIYAWAQTIPLRAGELAGAEAVPWVAMAAVGLALPLVGLVAASRAPGWRLAGWSASVGLALLGLASLLNPETASSIGRFGGWSVLLTGALLAFLVERERARPAAERPVVLARVETGEQAEAPQR